MIFVTVGTHEQQFNRLIEIVDTLKKNEFDKQDVFIQTGFSDYKPRNCQYKKFVSYDEMQLYMEKADIIITHGGPSSYMEAVAKGKKPLVMPRRAKFKEHVNDHQVDFANKIEAEGYIKVINNIVELKKEVLNYNESKTFYNGNNKMFVSQFKRMITDLIKEN